MSDAAGVTDVLRVLVVGDSPPIDATMDALSSRLESVSIVRERRVDGAIERLAHLDIHCLVCRYERTAPERFERLVDEYGDRPVVAVVASADAETSEAALSAGATDVVAADDPGALVATRVRNAAERGRLESAAPNGPIRDRLDRLESAVDALPDGVAVLEGPTVQFANAVLADFAGVETLVGRDVDAVVDDDLATAIQERARSPVARWSEPLSGTLVDGTPVEVFVTPLSAERTLCVVRDRRRSAAAALTTVQRAIERLRATDDRSAVRRAAVTAALEATPADLTAWFLVDGETSRPATVETAAADGTADLPSLDAAERDELLGDAAVGEAVAVDRSALESIVERAGIRAERAVAVPAGEHGFLLATSTDPRGFDERDRRPLEVLVGAATIALDERDRESALRSCRADRDRLAATVDRDRRLRELERLFLTSDSTEEIHRRLCDALGDGEVDVAAGAIELAWVGDVTAGTDRIEPTQWAGRDGDSLASVAVPTDDVDELAHSAARAVTGLDPVVVDDLKEHGGAGREWSRRALERGFRSVMSVPLVAGEFCYGVLTLYADAPGAFDDDARRLPVHVARVAGHAVAGVERKRALLADSVTELEVVVRAVDDPLATVADRLDRRLDVQAAVPRSTGGSTLFCTVASLEAEAVDDLESLPAVESARVVGDRADGALVELVVGPSTIAETLADHGGVLRSVSPVDGRTRLVVDLSGTVDVRSFVRMIDRRHGDASLVARRERDRAVQSARAFDAALLDRLSERQLRTLEAAYYGGFFEWPRGSTGEEIADSLGVSQPTFSRHLRLAQGKVFASLFDDQNGDTDE